MLACVPYALFTQMDWDLCFEAAVSYGQKNLGWVFGYLYLGSIFPLIMLLPCRFIHWLHLSHRGKKSWPSRRSCSSVIFKLATAYDSDTRTLAGAFVALRLISQPIHIPRRLESAMYLSFDFFCPFVTLYFVFEFRTDLFTTNMYMLIRFIVVSCHRSYCQDAQFRRTIVSTWRRIVSA